MAKNTTPDSLYGNSRDILREAERENEILADIAGEEYESPGDIPKGKYIIEKRLLDAAQKKNELLEAIAEGGGGSGTGSIKGLNIDYSTDVISLKNKSGETIEGSGATLPAYGLNYNSATGGLTLTKNGTAVQGQTVSLPDYGSPLTATSTAGMTDTSKVYVNTTDGKWYYYDGSAWTAGGTYNSQGIDTDTTLLVSGAPADAKATGDAVSDLKTQLNLSTGNEEIKLTHGAYIKLNGTTADIDNPTTDNNWNYAVIECNPGDIFTISGRGTSIARLFGFLDSSKNVIGTLTATTKITDYVVSAPSSAKYLVINNIQADLSKSYKGFFVKDNISKNESCYDYLFTKVLGLTPVKYNYGTYFATGTSIDISQPKYDKSYVSSIVPASQGDIFTISGIASSATNAWAFIDTNGVKITNGAASANNAVVVAPANTAYLVLNANANNPYYAVKGNVNNINKQMLINSIIPGTTSRVTKTDDKITKIEYINGQIIERTDTFVYSSESIVETRKLRTGEQLVITTNLDTLSQEVV